MTENEERDTDGLYTEAASLSNAVQSMNEKLGDQIVKLARVGRFNRRMIWILVFGFAVQIVLAVMVVVNLVSINNVTDRLNEVQRIQQEEALCPLYQIFVNSDTPQARERARAAGQDLEERDRSFKVIRNSYAALECEKFKK